MSLDTARNPTGRRKLTIIAFRERRASLALMLVVGLAGGLANANTMKAKDFFQTDHASVTIKMEPGWTLVFDSADGDYIFYVLTPLRV